MDTPALNPDGSLKDAAEIDWEYSPTQPSFPARAIACPPSPSPASSNLIISSLTPADFANPTQKHKAVPCERIFSDAGLADSKRRARLLPSNFGDIQIVKNHYKKERRRWEAET